MAVITHVIARWIKVRYVVAFMGAIGMAILYTVKVNFAIVIQDMVNHTAIKPTETPKSAEVCQEVYGELSYPVLKDGPYNWDPVEQGFLLSSYFWGYIAFQIPGAQVVALSSAKWVMFVAVLVNVSLTILTPILLNVDDVFMALIRVVQGLAGGVAFPAMHSMLAKWSVPAERGSMSSMVYGGCLLGTVLGIGVTQHVVDLLGWESVFYMTGAISSLWLLFWVLLVTDEPAQHTCISNEEMLLISSTTKPYPQVIPEWRSIPWTKIFTSVPFLAILLTHVFFNWGWYLIILEIPEYMSSVLHMSTSDKELWLIIIFLFMWAFSWICSNITTHLIKNKRIDTTQARKISTLLSTVMPAVFYIALSINRCSKYFNLISVFVATVFMGGMYSGFFTNHIDLSPNFAGMLMAVTNTAATIPGIIVPIVVGILLKNNPEYAWTIIFLITSLFSIIAAVIFYRFSNGTEQFWNCYEEDMGMEKEPLKADMKSYGEKEELVPPINVDPGSEE